MRPWGDHWMLGPDGEPVPFEGDDVLEWARWFESADRQIARTEAGKAVVSTVFLGIDHGFPLSDRPILFETMVFEGTEWSPLMQREVPRERYQARHASRAEALAHHERVVEALRAEWKPDKARTDA